MILKYSFSYLSAIDRIGRDFSSRFKLTPVFLDVLSILKADSYGKKVLEDYFL